MLTIDGSIGGGQMLRTALGLSILTGKAFTMERIRESRGEKGLKEQHLQTILACEALCNGETAGVVLGSKKIIFQPGQEIQPTLTVTIRTAGSVSLLLQSLLIAAIKHDLHIEIHGGGTYGLFSPPISYFEHVFFPLLAQMGHRIEMQIHAEGFFPRGGARLSIRTKRTKPHPLILDHPSKMKELHIYSIATKDLQERRVAERQAEAANKLLSTQAPRSIMVRYVQSFSTGSGILITAKTENSILAGDAIGERRRRAEDIAAQAITALQQARRGALDEHAADMLLPYLAIHGGSILAPSVTEHIETNKKTIEHFLGPCITIEGTLIRAEPKAI